MSDLIQPPKRVIQWDRVLMKYGSPLIPADIRRDVADLVGHSQTLALENKRLHDELRGAFQTMLAITRAVGEIEIPNALIDLLDNRDQLHISDVQTPNGIVKRFRYEAYTKDEILAKPISA